MAKILQEIGNFNSLLAICFCMSLVIVPLAEAKTHHYQWEVKYEYKSPDCFKKLSLTINEMSPGPTISAQQGDTIVVELKNSLLTENVAIHWHGIQQRGTPWSDGAEAVSQCPILAGETYTYKFVVDQAGTFLYHAHYGLQMEAGLYGFIVVSVPDGQNEPFTYDHDHTILLNDWYHKSPYEHVAGLSSIPFVFVGEPQSLLINGRGKFNCSLFGTSVELGELCNATNPECAPYVLTVTPGKTYRLRIGNLASLSALSFQIEGHNMTIVEADGNYVEPVVVRNLYIYSGETYSVLLTANQDPSRNYWLTTNVVIRKPATPLGLAIINYSPNNPTKMPLTIPPPGPAWDDELAPLAQSLALKSRKGFIKTPPSKPDRVIVLLNTQKKINGHIRWAINNVSLSLPRIPYLFALKNNLTHTFDQTLPPDNYDFANYDIFSPPNNVNATSSSNIYRLKFNSTVDVILQNANLIAPNRSEIHPWHLHGHDFWVLGYGTGKFDIQKDPKKFNLVNPIIKNTVALYPYGWTALRFKADNPGVWLFHCHIEAHFFLGMGVVFEEGVERLDKLPNIGCGESKEFISPQSKAPPPSY